MCACLSPSIQVSTKIPVLKSLLEKCDKILLGGGMIFTFYKAQVCPCIIYVSGSTTPCLLCLTMMAIVGVGH